MSAAIETTDLSRVYQGTRTRAPVRAVDDVALTVAQGEVLGLLGPNGAGKTTMVRLLACLLRPTTGTAAVAGYDIREQPNRVRSLSGVSVEAPGLYERLTAVEYLTFFGRLYGMSGDELRSHVLDQLRAANLWERRDDLLASYSKGMRQKVNIIRALIHRPRVAFLDEPTSGLDVEAALAVREHIQEMSQDTETTFLICTHNLAEAERLCTRIAVMNHGRIIATGTPDELRRRIFGERVFRCRLRQVLPGHVQAAASVPGVADVTPQGDAVVIRVDANEEEVNPSIIRALIGSGAEIISFAGEGRSLEEVYLRLVREGGEDA